MKSICILSSLYPNKVAPASQVFVQQFVWALADMGVDCTVICPVAVNLHPRLAQLPYSITELTSAGNLVKVYFPKFISFGQRNLAGFKTARLTTSFYYQAVHRVWKGLREKPEVIYGHFLTPAGITASRISKKYNIASFAAFGESTPWSILNYGTEKLKQEIHHLNGIVSVSTANRKLLSAMDVFPKTKVEVFPNGIHTSRFRAYDQVEARKKFGFPQNRFIVAFLGSFDDRKGVLRAASAVNGLDNVSIAFAGKGPLQPKGDNIIHSGIVKPEDVPYFLSAADVFLLPTRNEGCSNAVIEAMSCGLPIISSNLPFNEDILDDTNAVLIDPADVSAIRSAVQRLRDQPELRWSMRAASLQKAKSLTIDARARNIVQWVQEMM